MACKCGCGASEDGHCWNTSSDAKCVVCDESPCCFQVRGEPVCSYEHGQRILCGSFVNIRPLSTNR